jgi:hypothetical protein
MPMCGRSLVLHVDPLAGQATPGATTTRMNSFGAVEV